MILLHTLPPKWETLLHTILVGKQIVDIKLSTIRDAISALYEQENNKGGKGKGPQTANKLSAIKRKRNDPQFNQQKAPNQGTDNAKKRGKRAGKKYKQKSEGHDYNHDHSHIANTVSIPSPDVTHIAHFTPEKTVRKVVKLPWKKRQPGAYGTLNDAMSICEDLDVAKSARNLKLLEARLGGYATSSKVTVEDLEEEDLPPPVKRSKTASPPPPDDDEPLDWGSDLDVEIPDAAGINEDDDFKDPLVPPVFLLPNKAVRHFYARLVAQVVLDVKFLVL
ncbi:hypothetical protein BC834DRAFT_847138 [Gloeopeniophorella convolvens]|nr:hypothetical protein BC834DRAFT_847138 [Gloeopeniophorella convolvens]